MGTEIKIVSLSRTAKPVLRFLKMAYRIYRDDPYWVAPLLDDLRKVFTDANPLFEHAEMALWVATRDGEDVGRIAGILDRNYNRTQNDNAVFFGFFECINDLAVSSHHDPRQREHRGYDCNIDTVRSETLVEQCHSAGAQEFGRITTEIQRSHPPDHDPGRQDHEQ